MFNFESQVCDVCGRQFDKDSDIVVCPECGTPHHRECWHQLGHCVNQDKHAQGYEWQPVRKEPAPGSIKCPACGSIMPEGTLFCENCGRSLKMPTEAEQAFNQSKNPNIQVFGVPGMMGMTISNEDLQARAERELAGEFDGVPYKDMAVYIGPNAQYYIYKFRRMAANPKYRPFNFTAFLFTPLWFLFRKMWKMAIATAVLNFVTSIPTLIIMGVDMGVMSSAMMFPGIDVAADVLGFISIAASILFGFMAIPMYRKDTVKRLKKLKAEAGDNKEIYYRNVMRQAGPSKIGMLFVVLFVAFYFISSLTY